MQFDPERIEQREYGIIRIHRNHKSPTIWLDFRPQFPFKYLQVGTGTQYETIVIRNQGSYMEGYCEACN
jgi:hypothetical protein